MRRKLALALSGVMLLSSLVWAADNDGWTEAPLTESAQDGAWEEWCTAWETEKNDWENISLTPGEDETCLNFGWYSKESAGVPEFRWYTDDATSQAGVQTVSQSHAVPGYNSNKVSVEGIEPGVTYYYSYTIDGEWSEPVVYTAPEAQKGFSFVFFGDPQIGSSDENIPTGEESELGQDRAVRNDAFNWNNTVDKAYELNPDLSFMLSAGDQIQTRDKKTNDVTHAVFTDNEIEYAGYLSPELLKGIPVATTIGNHDALSSNYTYHFNNPNASEVGATYAGGDYYFTYGDALFIMINTNNTNVAEHKSFIEAACDAEDDVTWRIVTLHQDIYGSGEHSNEPEIMELRYGLVPVFEDNGIDVVLTGHDHTYSRSYMMKGGTKKEEAFISQDDFDMYIDGDKELDDTYNNYLTAIEDAEHITSTEDVVVNPEGILYMTANSASGSKYYDLVEHRQAYIAARWQEDVPTFSMVDITDSSFTINTYRTDTMEKIDTEFTIIKDSGAGESTTEATTESTTEAATTTTRVTTSTRRSSGGGSSSSKASTKAESTTEATTEAVSEVATEAVTTGEVRLTVGNRSVEIMGNTYSMDAAAYIQGETASTMVPLRFAALAVTGGDPEQGDTADSISWDALNKRVTVRTDKAVLTFTAGSSLMSINGVETPMDNGAKAEIVEGRMYIPFRALGTALGLRVDWEADTRTAVYKLAD